MELSCPAPKHCEYGRKMAAASEAHETPRLSATFSSHDPFKTARLNQAGRKNKLRHSCAVGYCNTRHEESQSLIPAFCETKKSRALKPSPEVANSGGPVLGGPVPVARSRWPGLVARSWSRARSRWPSPGGPGPGGPVPDGPVPVARSRSRFKGACPRARAKKDLFCPVHSMLIGTMTAVSSCTHTHRFGYACHTNGTLLSKRSLTLKVFKPG